MVQDIWILRSADSRNLALIPHDLDYFQTHFVGEPMRQNWEPPPARIDGKSLRLRDFVSWMATAPVVSESAKVALEPVIGEYVEFLPLTELRGQCYFAVNVLKIVDCLDRPTSQIVFSPSEPDKILSITTYGFIHERIENCPIFKLPDDRSAVFVRQPFINAVIRSRLTGAKFADPAANPFVNILQRKSCNVVPGILD